MAKLKTMHFIYTAKKHTIEPKMRVITFSISHPTPTARMPQGLVADNCTSGHR